MKARVCTLLILTQLLLGTLGHGALTLCVRTDGSKKVLWTLAEPCKSKGTDQNLCSCCGAMKEIDPDVSAWSSFQSDCQACQDYVLLAERDSISRTVYFQLLDDFSRFTLNAIVELPSFLKPEQLAVKFDASQTLPNSLSAIVSTVVIRC